MTATKYRSKPLRYFLNVKDNPDGFLSHYLSLRYRYIEGVFDGLEVPQQIAAVLVSFGKVCYNISEYLRKTREGLS